MIEGADSSPADTVCPRPRHGRPRRGAGWGLADFNGAALGSHDTQSHAEDAEDLSGVWVGSAATRSLAGRPAPRQQFRDLRRLPADRAKLPLELVRCSPELDENACGLVQLRHTTPGDLMYSSYGYRSGINQTMTQHLGGIARGLEEKLKLQPDDLVVDIGANDGTLLLSYRTTGLTLIGFEPSNIRPIESHAADSIHPRLLLGGRPARDPAAIARSGRSRASRCSTTSRTRATSSPTSRACWPRTACGSSRCRICRSCWRTTRSIPSVTSTSSTTQSPPSSACCSAHGLRIADAELNDANGGSIRITACRADSPFRQHSIETRSRIYRLKKQEFELKLDTEEPYRAFADNAEKIRHELPGAAAAPDGVGEEDLRVRRVDQGQRDPSVLRALDRLPDRQSPIATRPSVGGPTVGSDIPIISEEEMRAARPDYLLVLPVALPGGVQGCARRNSWRAADASSFPSPTFRSSERSDGRFVRSATIRRALVTGASGQDGHYLTRHLVAQGREVLGISRQSRAESLPASW